jgi:hypothetical protein
MVRDESCLKSCKTNGSNGTSLHSCITDGGLTMRDPEEGGKQEPALADRYRAQASTFSDSWPRTAVVLRTLASMYDTDAREEEARAERFRQGQKKGALAGGTVRRAAQRHRC